MLTAGFGDFIQAGEQRQQTPSGPGLLPLRNLLNQRASLLAVGRRDRLILPSIFKRANIAQHHQDLLAVECAGGIKHGQGPFERTAQRRRTGLGTQGLDPAAQIFGAAALILMRRAYRTQRVDGADITILCITPIGYNSDGHAVDHARQGFSKQRDGLSQFIQLALHAAGHINGDHQLHVMGFTFTALFAPAERFIGVAILLLGAGQRLAQLINLRLQAAQLKLMRRRRGIGHTHQGFDLAVAGLLLQGVRWRGGRAFALAVEHHENAHQHDHDGHGAEHQIGHGFVETRAA